MKKNFFLKVGILFGVFCFMSILIYKEYADYQKTFERDLVTFNEIQVQKEVLSSLTKMSKSAGRDHIRLKVRYGYLSLEEIQHLGNLYEEFQTGFLIEFDFQNEEEKMKQWLEENAYKYGFILRYPKEKEEKTKKISTTIYRYVGVDISTIMQEQHLCYEEYLERE